MPNKYERVVMNGNVLADTSPLMYLPVEHGPHDGVKGALGDEVVHVDRGRLPDAVGSILSLLDVAGVPVELGKHHVAGSG